MNGKFVPFALAAAILAGCAVEKDAEGDTSVKVSREAAQTGEKIAEGAKDLTNKAATATSQAAMTGKVSSALRSAGSLTIKDLNVDTVGNVITIEGSVPSAKQRQEAQELVQTMAGQDYKVENKLTVAPGS